MCFGTYVLFLALVSWPRFLWKRMDNQKFVGSFIELKACTHMLTVNFVYESLQDGCFMLTANYAFIEHFNSVRRIVSNEVIAQ